MQLEKYTSYIKVMAYTLQPPFYKSVTGLLVSEFNSTLYNNDDGSGGSDVGK